MDAEPGFLGRLGPSLLKVLPLLDERSRRLVLGMAAEAEGNGGTGRVASLAGASWQTVANGRAELASEEELPPGRARRPGGGRKRLAESDPGLAAELEKLIRDAMRGDPESPLVWTTRSAGHLAGELTAAGHPCSGSTVWRMLKRMGFTQQSNSRAQEGRQHPERDGQFRHIAARSREYLAAGDPVISVDSKKKEQVGNFGQDGREWAPAGEPVTVRSHDFPDRKQPHAIPYGIYDEKDNAGFVNVGTDGNTAALAVESIRRWWRAVGEDSYPGAARLLVTCDCGGSNGCTNRAWKAGLAALAQETGLDIEVCHFPPGTSKWNRIEHRLFCQISLAWRARPLTSYDVIIDTIGRVTTKTGLTAIAVLDENAYPTGTEIGDGQMRDIEERCLTRGAWHPEWNYTLLAHPAGPEPEPPAAPPDRHAILNHPALTGIAPGSLQELAAALENPYRSLLDYKAGLRRGGRRVNAARSTGPHGNRRIDVTDHVLITRLRGHLRLPDTVTAALFGVHRTTVSNAAVLTRRLLAEHAIPLPPAAEPPATPIRTLDDLREYAAHHGIAIPAPTPAADTAPETTLTTPDTPQTRLILKCCPRPAKLSALAPLTRLLRDNSKKRSAERKQEARSAVQPAS
jgi:Rhodopirellula transposase DDE domain